MTAFKRYVLIVAGGSGTRMNGPVPKQFMLLAGKPVLMHSLEKFVTYDFQFEIILVLPSAQFNYWKELCNQYDFQIPYRLVAGGDVRFESVKNGLTEISSDGLVAIHDGVRPLVSHETIERCFNVAAEKGNAIPVLPIVESIRMVEGKINYQADRERFVSIQTPQVFRLSEIKQAYEQGFDTAFTDDATVLERLGTQINLVEGNRENIKITHSIDLIVAEALLGNL